MRLLLRAAPSTGEIHKRAVPVSIRSAARWVALALVVIQGSGCAQSETPTAVARRVADKVIRETSFTFVERPQRFAGGIQTLDFTFNRSSPKENSGYAQAVVLSPSDTTVLLGLSHGGPIRVWINDAVVYSSRGKTGPLREFAYDMYSFPAVKQVSLNRGENVILVEGTAADTDGFASLCFLDHEGRIVEDVSFTVQDSASLTRWTYATDRRAGPAAWVPQRPRTIKDGVIPEQASFKGHTYFEWHYANGQMAYAILALGDSTQGQEYTDWVVKYCTTTLSTLEEFRHQYELLQVRRGFNYRIFRRVMLDDAAAPALPFIALTQQGRLLGARPLIDSMAAWVASGQTRLADGTLCRPEPSPKTVWADDLFMSVLFLLRYAELTGDRRYIDDAVNQAIGIFDRLYDTSTGLSAHAWFEADKRRSMAFWGRANGWMAWAISEVLRSLPASHPQYERILGIFQKQMAGIIRYQGRSGLWHQLLDRPDTYEETSCTAMFVIALARGIRAGWLPAAYAEQARLGWRGVCSRIAADGTVSGICQGTGIGPDLDFYARRKTPPHDPRGLGAVITAAIEMEALAK